jgi:O-methyltransferase involved in polyketide biosynthesis
LQISDASPEGVEILEADLEEQTIADALSTSSFARGERAFFSWLGTVPYLSGDAVFAVLGDLASLATQKSEVVLDYAVPISMWSPEDRQALTRVMRIVERRGETIKSFFAPDAFPKDVSRLGYGILDNVSSAELNKNYYSGRSDVLLTSSAAYLIHAQITETV